MKGAAGMKCSFCEQPLVCKACGKPFRPLRDATHLAAYQPDMQVFCPECQQPLACKVCGFAFGEPDEDES
jgi:hypothetical protein